MGMADKRKSCDQDCAIDPLFRRGAAFNTLQKGFGSNTMGLALPGRYLFTYGDADECNYRT